MPNCRTPGEAEGGVVRNFQAKIEILEYPIMNMPPKSTDRRARARFQESSQT